MSLKQIQEALEIRYGGAAQVWSYSVSHQWLTIRLTKHGLAGNFHLLCGACDRLEFDTAWLDSNLQVERSEAGFVVRDGAHLRVECGIVTGRYNVPPVFGIAGTTPSASEVAGEART